MTELTKRDIDTTQIKQILTQMGVEKLMLIDEETGEPVIEVDKEGNINQSFGSGGYGMPYSPESEWERIAREIEEDKRRKRGDEVTKDILEKMREHQNRPEPKTRRIVQKPVNETSNYFFNDATGSALVVINVAGFSKEQIEVTSIKNDDEFLISVKATRDTPIPEGYRKIGNPYNATPNIDYSFKYKSDIDVVKLINGELFITTKPLKSAVAAKPKKFDIS